MCVCVGAACHGACCGQRKTCRSQFSAFVGPRDLTQVVGQVAEPSYQSASYFISQGLSLAYCGLASNPQGFLSLTSQHIPMLSCIRWLLGTKIRSSCLEGKYFTKYVISPGLDFLFFVLAALPQYVAQASPEFLGLSGPPA